MTTPNLFPPDILQELRDLQQTVKQLQAAVARRTPLTGASAGWLLPNMSPPPNPADGVHLYGNGDDLAVLLPNGTVKRIPGLGAPVDIVPNMTAGPIGGAPTMAQYNNLYNDAVAIRATLNELIGVLRAAGYILT